MKILQFKRFYLPLPSPQTKPKISLDCCRSVRLSVYPFHTRRLHDLYEVCWVVLVLLRGHLHGPAALGDTRADGPSHYHQTHSSQVHNISIYLSIYLSIQQTNLVTTIEHSQVYIYIHLSIYLSIQLSIYLSSQQTDLVITIKQTAARFIYVYLYTYLYLSIYSSIYLSI